MPNAMGIESAESRMQAIQQRPNIVVVGDTPQLRRFMEQGGEELFWWCKDPYQVITYVDDFRKLDIDFSGVVTQHGKLGGLVEGEDIVASLRRHQIWKTPAALLVDPDSYSSRAYRKFAKITGVNILAESPLVLGEVRATTDALRSLMVNGRRLPPLVDVLSNLVSNSHVAYLGSLV